VLDGTKAKRDRRLYTVALARGPVLLETFEVGQTYLLGKKRTMMQVTKLSEIVQEEERDGTCQTGLLQLAPDAIRLFRTFDIVAATMRYLILQGETRVEDGYVEFDLPGMLHSGAPLALPRFYLQETPIGQRGS
jgi:hypothetical protein